ncbi:2-methoxy-6-polyprenyl-1,4-benzoquinol methylase [subsurface metagenome]
MESPVEKWIGRSGEKFLHDIGIINGQKVLDFGCGSGNYTIPVARIVGEQGLVYALDEDEGALDRLMSSAKLIGLKNIVRLDASTKLGIALDDESVDVVLLYDILHHYYFPHRDDRKRLLCEVYRVLRPNAILSLYPTHLQSYMEPSLEDVKREIEEAHFYQENEYSGIVMVHDDNLEKGSVINFRKGNR